MCGVNNPPVNFGTSNAEQRFGGKGGNQNHKLSHEPRNAKEAKKAAKVSGQANKGKNRKRGDVRFGEKLNITA